ncbi:MAG: HypC/HybG/HupF family hydrogenase formation chaperone [Xanthomonadales bacterium]|nr:HypC/HybG/HupF family hydrogenase formation chaperone [Xanthomonadales bacterium]
MCLGVPMRIVEIDGFNARCEARGIERKASLFLLQHENVQVGDMVMIHVGNAIQKMSEEEALSAWEIYDEMLALEDEASGRA